MTHKEITQNITLDDGREILISTGKLAKTAELKAFSYSFLSS